MEHAYQCLQHIPPILVLGNPVAGEAKKIRKFGECASLVPFFPVHMCNAISIVGPLKLNGSILSLTDTCRFFSIGLAEYGQTKHLPLQLPEFVTEKLKKN